MISVSRATKTLVRGTNVSTLVPFLIDIPAMVFKKSSSNLNDTDLGTNTEKDSYEVIIEPNDIQVGDSVSITLSPTFSQNDYVVETVDYHYSKITNNIDNVYFTIKRQYG